MNGNFERDLGAYPYSRMAIGDSIFVVHMPTLQKVLNVPMPPELAANVALRINSKYHAAKRAGGAKFDGSTAGTVRIVREAMHDMKQQLGPSYDQLKRQVYEAAYSGDPKYREFVDAQQDGAF